MLVSENLTEVFTETEQEDILQAIKYAEIDSSCEFKVHVDHKCPEDSAKRARHLFHKLGVDKTVSRNGIMFYLALDCRKFIIKPDQGVEQTVPKDFWDEIYHIMLVHFRKEEYAAGLAEAIQRAGEKLKAFFPWDREDQNEVPDDISVE